MFNQARSPQFLYDIDISKKYKPYLAFKQSLNIFNEESKFMLKPNTRHMASRMKSWEKEGILKLFKPVPPASEKSENHVLKYSQHKSRDAYMYLSSTHEEYALWTLKCLNLKYNQHSTIKSSNILNTWNQSININFLRKERLYTKLKYSRSPAYDIVSGGAAAILAGFIGFLISEKFGYELVDSGDFYYLFMYLVFLSFSVRPLLIVSDANKGFWDTFSLKRLTLFYSSLIQIILKKFK